MSYSLSEALDMSFGLEEFDVDINIGNIDESPVGEVEGTAEIIESAAEIESITESVETAIDDVESLENIHLVLKASAMNGGMNKVGYAMVNVALEGISKKYGGTATGTYPSMESFNDNPNYALQVSMEETDNALVKFYKFIKELLAKAWNKIKAFFGKALDMVKNATNRLTSLWKKADMLDIAAKAGVNLEDKGLFTTIGGYNGVTTKEIVNNYTKDAEGAIDTLKSVFKEADSIIQKADFDIGYSHRTVAKQAINTHNARADTGDGLFSGIINKIKKPVVGGPLSGRVIHEFSRKMGYVTESTKSDNNYNIRTKMDDRVIKTSKEEIKADIKTTQAAINKVANTAKGLSRDFEKLKKTMERSTEKLKDVSGKSELKNLLAKLINAVTSCYTLLITDMSKAHAGLVKLNEECVKALENHGKPATAENSDNTNTSAATATSTESYNFSYNPFFG